MTKPQTDVGGRIILGDCLEVMKTFEDNQFDLVLTDPPYGIGYKPTFKKWDGRESDYSKITNDDGDFDYKSMFDELMRISKVAIVFGGEHFLWAIPNNGSWLCWDKRPAHIQNEMIGSAFELAWCSKSGSYKIYRVLHGGVINADSTKGNNAKRYHPTQKPVKLFSKIIQDYTKEGDTVLDPFLGSGTTAIACKNLNRNCIGIEIDPEYVKIAEERLKQEILL